MRSRRVCRRVSVSDETAEEREHSECDDPPRVVVEIVGQVERGTSVLERSDKALLEARRPRETAVSGRLQRRLLGRLAQGFLEQRNGTVESLELGEEDERLGAERADTSSSAKKGLPPEHS